MQCWTALVRVWMPMLRGQAAMPIVLEDTVVQAGTGSLCSMRHEWQWGCWACAELRSYLVTARVVEGCELATEPRVRRRLPRVRGRCHVV